MTAITLTAANISCSEERGAVIERYTTGEAISLGMAVYLDSSNLAWKAIANSSAHANAIGIAVIADNFAGETSIPAGGTVGVCVFGPVYGFPAYTSQGLSQGEVLWVDKTTAGSLNDSAPTGGAYQYVVGHMTDSEVFFVDPGTSVPASHS
jgi:hypothetical protein